MGKWTWTVGLLVASVFLVGAPASEAGKPGGSKPLVLTGVSPWSENVLFDSDQVLPVAQAEFGSSVDTVWMYRDLKADADGVLYTLIQSYDSTNTVYIPQSDFVKKTWSGILRHDGTAPEIVDSTYYTFDAEPGDAYDLDLYTGAWMSSLDAAPLLSSSATGDLADGDLVALRWRDDDPATTTLKDDIMEVVHFRPVYDTGGEFAGLSEEAVLHAFPQVSDYGGDVAVDPLGRIYVRIPHTAKNANGGYDHRLWLLTWNATSGDYEATDARPTTFEMQGSIEVDDEGALYLMGRNWGTDSGTIFRKPVGGSWAPYAFYVQKCCVEGFRAWTHDAGTFAIALRRSLQKGDYYVGLVSPGATVDFANRIADTAIRSVDAMTADPSGSVYVLHTDRIFVDNVYEIAQQTVYRLDRDPDGGGGSPGNGKGKNK